jgi:protein phosphatase
VEPGDIYLLCSDGLSDMVQDEDIHSTLSTLQSNLPLAAKQLVQLANDCGGRDNISVILVRILEDFAVPKGWLAKFTAWFR